LRQVEQRPRLKEREEMTHGGLAGNSWIVLTVIAVIVVGAIWWMGHTFNATNTGSAINSRSTTGSDTSRTGRR